MLDLSTCSASDLATWLSENRFDTALSTTTFLLEAVSSLPEAEAIAAQLMGEENDQAASSTPPLQPETLDLGEPLLTDDEIWISATQPRGKFCLSACEHGLQLMDKKKNESLRITKIDHCLVFPKPEDCQRSMGLDHVLLVFAPVDYKGKAVTQVCFTLPLAKPVWRQPDEDDADEDDRIRDHTDQWTAVLCRALSLTAGNVCRIRHPDDDRQYRWQFSSHDDGQTSTTTSSLPFVRCYQGVHDGVLFPLKEGLLFFRPPLFVARSQLTSIAAGRGADASSRYIDVQVALESGETLEFTNIHRSELSGLQKYIHSILIPAMQADVGDDLAVPVARVTDSSSSSRRARRLASRDAHATIEQQWQHATEDSEDDEDDDYILPAKSVAEDDEDDESDDESDAEDNGGDEEEEAGADEAIDEEDDATESEVDDEDDDVPAAKKVKTK